VACGPSFPHQAAATKVQPVAAAAAAATVAVARRTISRDDPNDIFSRIDSIPDRPDEELTVDTFYDRFMRGRSADAITQEDW